MRLQKYLSEAGVASRRKSEEFILAGRVTVNGETVRTLGTKVDDAADTVLFDGAPVKKKEQFVYLMLHKPEGYVTTSKDQFDRPAVLDLLKDVKERVFPVGRLDFDTSGLLILTNDGELTYKLTHPKHNIDKVYIARLFGEPTAEELARFRGGVEIDGRTTAPASIEIIKKDARFTSAKITIKEGRNRQVRKMCEAIDHKVAVLKRVATGKLFLGDLQKGDYRHLTKAEVAYLKNI
ncbi:MAG: rRNA pseudouridine synthase [Clostridiales bacterium]|nr:rRNA pseudouridine synthase [Clostridiales bacterium]